MMSKYAYIYYLGDNLLNRKLFVCSCFLYVYQSSLVVCLIWEGEGVVVLSILTIFLTI